MINKVPGNNDKQLFNETICIQFMRDKPKWWEIWKLPIKHFIELRIDPKYVSFEDNILKYRMEADTEQFTKEFVELLRDRQLK